MRASKSPLFHIKVCGITRAADAVSAAKVGADAIGLNFFPGSPRCVSLELASMIANELRSWAGQAGLSCPLLVGVFVNATSSEIVAAVEQCRLNAVQLHGDECPSQIAELKAHIPSAVNGHLEVRVSIIRAIRSLAFIASNANSPMSDSSSLSFDVGQIVQEAQVWFRAGADAVLLDAAAQGQFGGTGRCLDWSLIKNLNFPLPTILAGGLTPENVAEAIRLSGLRSVDVASGVERNPREKDELLMRNFVRNAGLIGG